MPRFLRQFLHEIADGMNPLVVLEFRRLRRSGILAVVGTVYFLYLCGLVYYLFREWNTGTDRLPLVLASLPLPILLFVAGFYEGRVATEQWNLKNEILELNGLSPYEKYLGHLLIGVFTALFFVVLSVPPVIALAFLDTRFALILPGIFFLVSVAQAFRLIYAYNTPSSYRRCLPGETMGEEIYSGVPTCLIFITFGILYFAAQLNHRLDGAPIWNDSFWFGFVAWCLLVLFAYAVLAFVLTRRYLIRPGLLSSRLALVNIGVNVSVMLLVTIGWFVCRCLFR